LPSRLLLAEDDADIAQIKGGLRDKPGKPVDYYHTCYCLSGLSAAQHYGSIVVGPPENLLPAVDPLCNIVHPRLAEARLVYSQLPLNSRQTS
jgi:protein farnesyltransferase subunit beta